LSDSDFLRDLLLSLRDRTKRLFDYSKRDPFALSEIHYSDHINSYGLIVQKSDKLQMFDKRIHHEMTKHFPDRFRVDDYLQDK
jgi:hypothetical protein